MFTTRARDIATLLLVIVLKTRLQIVENELQNERRRRQEAEQLVKDVEKESKEPFVVPALLDAFAAISRLSGEALMSRLL
jgi:1-aminocyclopropane-1-carboxylate deaminase/D-cysteine desulfhydrase-like pyridoxal-dependent ACC family enzyme